MRIVFIGSGNVATHMANAFKAEGHDLVQVYSKQLDNAVLLAERMGAKAINDFSEIDKTADVYVIAVIDSAIEDAVAHLDGVDGLVIHTSGATALTVMRSLKSYGVLYPLQTFSKSVELDFKKVPLFIESGDIDSLRLLRTIASGLVEQVYEVDSTARRILHLAAVFACNFVNQLYTLSSELVEQHNLQFQMLRPLIMETARKIQKNNPIEVQTGPAIRNDQKTIDAHLSLLHEMPDLSGIYQTLSESIKKTHQ